MTTLTVAKDTNVQSSINAGFNYGGGLNATVGMYTSGKNDFPSRMLMAFDLAAVAGSTLTAVELHVVTLAASPAAFDCHLYRMTRDWTEGTKNGSGTPDGATWNTYDGTNAWTTAGGDYTTTDGVAFSAPTATGTFVVTGLLSLAQDAIANRANILNVILKADDEATSHDFILDQRESSGNAATLVVTVAASGSRRRGGVV